MKSIFIACFILVAATRSIGQTSKTLLSVPDNTKKILVVEAACGECKFHMHGSDCELAVRINGKTYFVDGADIDDYGNAHDTDGFCNAIRKAEVQGEIVNNRFKLTYFKLLKPEEVAGQKPKAGM